MKHGVHYIYQNEDVLHNDRLGTYEKKNAEVHRQGLLDCIYVKWDDRTDINNKWYFIQFSSFMFQISGSK